MESALNDGNKLEVLCESGPSSSDNINNSISTFIDGQAVQLEDGSTAYIYRNIKENMDEQNIQSISLEDGSTAYIHQPTCNTAITQTELSIDESKSPQNFRCDQVGCGKLYSSSHHLRVHKRSHTGEKPYKCEWEGCGKSFSTSYSLRSHIRVHTGEKPYNCTYVGCGKAFKTAGDLQKHVRIHTGEKPYKCPFQGCGKAFTTTNICKVHIRTHTGERPYKCPFPDCEKMFKNSTNYKNHVRIHTGEKPFVCDYPSCNKRFTEYSSFYKHKVVHADDRKKSCARTMKRDEMENKDNGVYYKCSLCGKTFAQRALMQNHKLLAHDKSDVLESEKTVTADNAKKNHVNDLRHSNKQPTSENRTRYDKDAYNMEKNPSAEQSRVVLLPVTSIESKSPNHSDTGDTIAQVAAVVTASSGQQLALLSHDGSTQQFTIALTDQGSTLLMPHSENESDIETSVKSDNQVVFIKDNTLQRMEASENNSTSTSDATPINADIWLHQPQRDEISSIGVKEEICLKENDNMQYENSSNTCEDGSSSDSIAYLEIGGAKYQLKIVTAESDEVDQDNGTVDVSNQPSTSEAVVQTLQMWPDSNKDSDDKVKYSDLTFLTSHDSSQDDETQSEKQESAISCTDNGVMSAENTSLYNTQCSNKRRKL